MQPSQYPSCMRPSEMILGLPIFSTPLSEMILTPPPSNDFPNEEDDVVAATAQRVFKHQKRKASPLREEAVETKKIKPLDEISYFKELKAYIEQKYPSFPIEDYSSIEELQKKGHPLHFALQQGDRSLFKLLIRSGADFHQVDDNGDNILALIIAKYTPHSGYNLTAGGVKDRTTTEETETFFKLAEILIEKGISPFQKNNSSISPIDLILSLMHTTARVKTSRLFDSLLRTSFNNIKALDTEEKMMAAEASLRAVPSSATRERLIELKCNVNAFDELGRPPLYFAISYHDREFIRQLCELEADDSLKGEVDVATNIVSPRGLAVQLQEEAERRKIRFEEDVEKRENASKELVLLEQVMKKIEDENREKGPCFTGLETQLEIAE